MKSSNQTQGLYEHSVVEVAMRLHGCDIGTGEGMPSQDRDELVTYLKWRLAKWSVDPLDSPVDATVRAMVTAVLVQAAEKR